MLPFMEGSRTRLGAESVKASAGVRQRQAAQFFPAPYRFASAEPHVPLVGWWRDGNSVSSLGLKA